MKSLFAGGVVLCLGFVVGLLWLVCVVVFSWPCGKEGKWYTYKKRYDCNRLL